MSLLLTATFKSYTQDRNGMRTESASVDVPGCFFAPGASSEALVNADQATETGTLYAPYGTDPTPYERVLLPGDSVPWEINGTPNDWVNPFTRTTFGTVVNLRRVIG